MDNKRGIDFSPRRRGFTAIELITVILVLIILAPLVLPTFSRAWETHNCVMCASRLKQLGLACNLYANVNHGEYPRTKYEPADRLIPNLTNAGFDSANPFSGDSKVPANNIPAALFLLMRTGDCPSYVFNCPSSNGTDDNYGSYNGLAPQNRSNFTNIKRNLTYSYANPYPDNAAASAGFDINIHIDAGFAIAADLNPGLSGGISILTINTSSSETQLRLANSRNHGRDGQNVLYADGHVEFQHDCLAGLNHDNIYCRGSGGPSATAADIVNSPKDMNDSVLLSVETP